MSRTDDNAEAARPREGAQPPVCPACGAAARRVGARFCATCGRSLRERDYRPADGLRASYRWQTSAELSPLGRETASRSRDGATRGHEGVSRGRDTSRGREGAPAPGALTSAFRLSAAARLRSRPDETNSRPRREASGLARGVEAGGRGVEAGGRGVEAGGVEVGRPWLEADARAARLTGAHRLRVERRNAPTARAYVFLVYALMPFIGFACCPCAVVCGARGLRLARRERAPHAEREAERAVVYAILLFGAQSFLWLICLSLTGWL